MTQQEIVDRLGISRGTLQRVLTGSPLVKASTRERVLAELERVNYVPNVIAAGLKTRRTKTIGIVGPAAIRMSNIAKVNAIHQTAREKGYSVIFGFSDGSSEKDAECIRDLRARMVDGVIALGRGLPYSNPHYQALIDAGIPLVTMYPLPELRTDCVYVDTRSAYRKLTRHLISLGHRNIGILLDPSASQFTMNRELGYRDAMKAAKIPVREEWVVRAESRDGSHASDEKQEKVLWNTSDYQYGFWGATSVLSQKKRPSALVCLSDNFAIGALRAANLAGVRVPEELALVGFDDNEGAAFASVPLTTIRQPDETAGRVAVDLLLDRINGKIREAGPVIRKINTTLVVRESCGSQLLKR